MLPIPSFLSSFVFLADRSFLAPHDAPHDVCPSLAIPPPLYRRYCLSLQYPPSSLLPPPLRSSPPALAVLSRRGSVGRDLVGNVFEPRQQQGSGPGRGARGRAAGVGGGGGRREGREEASSDFVGRSTERSDALCPSLQDLFPVMSCTRASLLCSSRHTLAHLAHSMHTRTVSSFS